ncbi:MAG TPA: tRNA (guanosine(46)-N7)-methyltransferase TrmB [Bacilli bacterium]|nr:tRNA (guanosine(46)-N7)-methyltransferase TrmB [Bacilli bacterium]HPS19102.1 tRNA (guanosine(46)-N7)-methyltransferase TrmB [Bacilli bacterium]
MRTKYKPWTKPYIEQHSEAMMSLETLKDFSSPFALEIGCGKGKFLLDMAELNPDVLFVGVERNVTCAGITCKKLVEKGISNAKLIFSGADEVLASLENDSVATIFLNFSDPWPKKRHQKRRLTSINYLKQYYRVLNKGGQLIIKTDNGELFAFSQETLKDSSFKVTDVSENYDGKAKFDAMTEYEISFRKKGQIIHRIVAVKE